MGHAARLARAAAARGPAGRGRRASARRARWSYMQMDKKVLAGRVRLVLLERLGRAHRRRTTRRGARCHAGEYFG
jgi:3-dehydroquinate synthetase